MVKCTVALARPKQKARRIQAQLTQRGIRKAAWTIRLSGDVRKTVVQADV